MASEEEHMLNYFGCKNDYCYFSAQKVELTDLSLKGKKYDGVETQIKKGNRFISSFVIHVSFQLAIALKHESLKTYIHITLYRLGRLDLCI